MTYELMHKDVPVIQLDIEKWGWIETVGPVISEEHMPLGIQSKTNWNHYSLYDWWDWRFIPMHRSGLDEILYGLGMGYDELFERSLALNLTDFYWIRPVGSGLSWRDVNMRDNGFSEEFGDVLMDGLKEGQVPDLRSPDICTNGDLRKRWKMIDGKANLVKHGYPDYYQEPFNEVVASRIMDLLDIPHAEYRLLKVGDEVFSTCPTIFEGNVEFVPAVHVYINYSKRNDVSDYQNYIDTCRSFGVDVTESVDDMLIVDYLICNYDRHYNNFGIIRDPETLEWMGPAPIFDSGASLGCNVSTEWFYEGRSMSASRSTDISTRRSGT
ncbi:MAG: excisionase [Candidatus Methanomethylophilaceae archaeon]